MDNSDLNAEDANGQTLLMQAAKMKNINLLKELLSKGVQLNTTDHDGNHALLLAQLSSDNDACVSTLIKAGSSINVMNNDRQTPLAIAMIQNNRDILKELLNFGADVNYVFGGVYTYLVLALDTPQEQDYIKDLLAKGADPNLGDIPVLMSSAQSEKLATMEQLLNAGADINYVHDFNGSILNIAAELGNFEMLKLAFRHGALVNIMPIPKSYAPWIPNDCALRLLCASGQMWPFITTKDMPNELVTEINEKSLRNFTHEAIRNHMIHLTNNNLFSQVERLPITQLMKDYLLYNTSI